MKRWILIVVTIILTSCNTTVPQKAQPIDLAQFESLLNSTTTEKVEVINFWATWCMPCVEELPAFEKLRENYNEDVEIILISLDDEDKIDQLVNPFLEKNNIQSTVKLMTHPYAAEWIPQVDAHWDGAIPVTLIKHKNIKRFYNQDFTYNELVEEVEKFL